MIHFEEKYGVTVGAATMLRQRRQAREELKVRAEPVARQAREELKARAEPEAVARQARVARAEPLRFLILVENRYALTCRTKTSFCLFNE